MATTTGMRLQTRVQPALADRLRTHAARERRSVSAVIRLAIERTLDGSSETSLADVCGDGTAAAALRAARQPGLPMTASWRRSSRFGGASVAGRHEAAAVSPGRLTTRMLGGVVRA